MPVESARAVFLRLPAGKCATRVIRAAGAVETDTPTLLPSAGCLRVTVAVHVSGVGAGVGVSDATGTVFKAVVAWVWVLEHAASAKALTASTADTKHRARSRLT